MGGLIGAEVADTLGWARACRVFPCLSCAIVGPDGGVSPGYIPYHHGMLADTYTSCGSCQPHAIGVHGSLADMYEHVRPVPPMRYVAAGAVVVDRAVTGEGQLTANASDQDPAACRAARRAARQKNDEYTRSCGQRDTQHAVAIVRRALERSGAQTLTAKYQLSTSGTDGHRWTVEQTVFLIDKRPVPFMSVCVDGFDATWELQEAAAGLEAAAPWLSGTGSTCCTITVDQARGVSATGSDRPRWL